MGFRFSLAGRGVWDRGSVLGANGALVSVLGDHYGPTTGVFATLDSVQLSNVAYASGIDDADLNVFVARCPSGTLSQTTWDAATFTSQCTCNVNSLTASCACDNGASCGCDSTGVCTCQGVGSAQFERDLETTLQNVRTECGCAVALLAITQEDAATTASQLVLDVVPTNENTTIPINSSTSSLVLGVLVQTLEDGLEIIQPTGFQVDILKVSQVLGVISWELAFPFPYEQGFSIAEIELNLAIVGNATLLLAPDGIPIPPKLVTFSASSSQPNHPPNAASEFEGTWWASVPGDVPFSWIAATFEFGAPVLRLLVDVAYADLEPTLPLELFVDVLNANQEWIFATTFVYTVERNWVVMPSADPIFGVRIRSLFPFGIRQLTPFVDQTCSCFPNLGNDVQQLSIVSDLAALRSSFGAEYSAKTLAKQKLANVNPDVSPDECVCLNDCVMQIGNVSVPVSSPAAAGGQCNDVLNYV